ncbi:glycine cleavage T C-terminal barrel domain-containing protein [Streptosporangium sp. NPDC002544]|uniref:glycine cleavage T C-terminal barrel domain-containing protein n=1 Tax=Streptosporangium sp. NPDC002544 TaxID=3154538 RepID=UPI003318A0D1
MDRPVMAGKEPVFAHGAPVGYVTSADYGFTIGTAIAYAWLPPAPAVASQRLEIEYFGERLAAVVAEEPLYDPRLKRLRVRAG